MNDRKIKLFADSYIWIAGPLQIITVAIEIYHILETGTSTGLIFIYPLGMGILNFLAIFYGKYIKDKRFMFFASVVFIEYLALIVLTILF